ncbi:MAG: hypothetical protein E7Z88_03510 [Cyanobacteria bacterium SIG27]|nr:hypothetical protein [Cyanobacteria bacterium SIG27]
MKKVSFLILLYLIINIFLNTMAQAKNAVINPDYQKEEFHWCPSMEEAGYWTEKYIDKYNCIAASINLYSKQQYEIALDFAKKIKYIYKTQDINALANIAPYPNVYIHNYKNKKFIEIKSKEELLKLDKSILLNKSMLDEINNSYLNWNWKGFMFSRTGIHFFVKDKVDMLSIHL